jgi:hypothetical protein
MINTQWPGPECVGDEREQQERAVTASLLVPLRFYAKHLQRLQGTPLLYTSCNFERQVATPHDKQTSARINTPTLYNNV